MRNTIPLMIAVFYHLFHQCPSSLALRNSLKIRPSIRILSFSKTLCYSPIRHTRDLISTSRYSMMNDDASSSSVTAPSTCYWEQPSSSGGCGAPGSLERLCHLTLRACQIMNPLISSIYQQMIVESSSSSSSKLENTNNTEGRSRVQNFKQDSSAFTIADGLVQRLLTKVVFSRFVFRDIVREEDDSDEYAVELGEESWFQVQGLMVPNELRPVVESTKAAIETLLETHFISSSSENDRERGEYWNYQNLTVFIDPIDGTREFSTGMGEQCSICVGFANEHGKAVAGVIYRPLSQPTPTWVAGSKLENFPVCDFGGDQTAMESLNHKKYPSMLVASARASEQMGSLLTTNGSISPFLESLIEELQMNRVKSGGAGNKLMLLLEQSLFGNGPNDKSILYIQDRGVSRWDTCAAEGVLEAFGGKVVKLTNFLPDMIEGRYSSNKKETYTYLASQKNLDFIPGVATITKYNCSPNFQELQGERKAYGVNEVKAYSNLCGLVAFGKEWNTPEGIDFIKMAIQRASGLHPPSFD